MADLRKLSEKEKAQYNAQKSVRATKQQAGIGQGLLDVLKGGEKPRAILGGLLGGDTSALSGAWNEVKQLADPNYMRNVKGINSTEAMDIALNANPVMAATFIGKGANTWDAANASKAMKMADKGIDERTIWEKTGTFKGADGQWRQEMSDHNASINKSALPNRIINGMKVEDWKVNDALNHQPLYEAYPSIANIESSFQNKGGASYNPLMDWISYSDRMKNPLLSIKQKQEIAQSKGAFDALHSSPEYKRYDDVTTKAFDLNPNITDAEFNAIHNAHNGDYLTQESSRLFNQYQKVKDNYMANPMGGNSLGDDIGMPAKAVTLHELQHAIQHREGFAQGGSPEAMREDALAMLRRDVASGEIPSTEQAMAMLPDAQLNAYKRLAGEAEARATESRINLTPQERRTLFPFDSYDVPRESLIVRGLLGGQ